eukprot:366038-Hanusia_phi.AAC.1
MAEELRRHEVHETGQAEELRSQQAELNVQRSSYEKGMEQLKQAWQVRGGVEEAGVTGMQEEVARLHDAYRRQLETSQQDRKKVKTSRGACPVTGSQEEKKLRVEVDRLRETLARVEEVGPRVVAWGGSRERAGARGGDLFVPQGPLGGDASLAGPPLLPPPCWTDDKLAGENRRDVGGGDAAQGCKELLLQGAAGRSERYLAVPAR